MMYVVARMHSSIFVPAQIASSYDESVELIESLELEANLDLTVLKNREMPVHVEETSWMTDELGNDFRDYSATLDLSLNSEPGFYRVTQLKRS